ncbi:hypothetical protein O1611_g2178 [Lasiodiplodia mahajangana]|uniref:Uncharacterized protein n=1 Tax=Lasiodiplodia mahajangana TaxID=1108764 RepID=A0ACC2JV98_9PEZI|nr:hypothetical protein O1611_g2178 [Lasiodiplodia mahajangana]
MVRVSEKTTYVIALDPKGEGGAYRIKNQEGEVNRNHILERGTRHIVQADLVDVLHGTLEPNGDLATLVVTDFKFMPGADGRRFKLAQITYVFSGDQSQPGLIGPDVFNIAPKGHFSLGRTSREVEVGHTVNLTIQAPAPVAPQVGYAMDLKRKYTQADQTTLEGTIQYQGREMGGKNVAKWILGENSAARSGIPTNIRTAVLLKRREEEDSDIFEATVEITVESDWKSTLVDATSKLLGRIPKDDPIHFDPTISTKGAADKYNGENLVTVNLEDIMQVTTTKWIDEK